MDRFVLGGFSPLNPPNLGDFELSPVLEGGALPLQSPPFWGI